MYYNGSSYSFDNGDVLIFGERGTVVGPPTLASHAEGLTVLFDGNKRDYQLFLNQLSREPLPSLPSGEYTWHIPGFSKIEETKLYSPTFQAGAFNWCDAPRIPLAASRMGRSVPLPTSHAYIAAGHFFSTRRATISRGSSRSTSARPARRRCRRAGRGMRPSR